MVGWGRRTLCVVSIDFSPSLEKERERKKEKDIPQSQCDNRRGEFRETYFYKEMDETRDKYLKGKKRKGNDEAVLAK